MSSNIFRVVPLLVVAAVLATVGCVTMETTAHTRAVNDLRCAEDQVVMTTTSGH